MDRARFRDWVSSTDELTAAQRREAAAVLSDPPEGEASLAAIELGTGEERRCPHCGTGGTVSRGKSPRHRHQVSRQLSEVAPSRRAGRHPSPRACLAAASFRTRLRFAN